MASGSDGVTYDGFATLVLAALVFGLIVIWLVNSVLGMITRPAARDER